MQEQRHCLLYLVIEIVRDARCDDGTEPTCKMVPPICDPASEILAHQENCYSCANSDTCKPWGIPGCEDDADCGDPETCDPCAATSCPDCEDCVPACIPPLLP